MLTARETCQDCGAPISGGRDGLCAKCLLGVGLERDEPGPPLDSDADLTPILLKPAPPFVVKFHTVGEYQLIEEIARGGMGVVYKARQVSLNRVVAIKFIHPGKLISPEAVRRFETEAEAAARLEHPNIIPIYDVGEHVGQHWFSMKLVQGGTLADPPPEFRGDPRRAATLLLTIARAVHYAHQRGVLHRDLKPSNILLDEQGQPFVTDFSLAKLVAQESHVTLSGDVVGTPSYMAPEQASGQARTLTTAADVYGLGAVLYELLTGRPPFVAENVPALLRKLVDEEPVPPSRLVPGTIDRDLETICLRCLEKAPARRYPSAEALADDLDLWLRHEPILSRRSTQRERLFKWARRQPVLASALGLLVAVLALGIGGVVWQWRRADAASRQALRVNVQLGKALNQMDAVTLQRTEELIAQGQHGEALPWLALMMRNNPSNRVVAERILTTFSSGNWPHLSGRPLEHPGRVNSASFSRDGSYILTAAENVGWLWDAQTAQSLRSFPHSAEVTTAEFGPRSRLVATASEDGKVRVWDSRDGAARTPWLEHSSPVRVLRFSADEEYLATGCMDGSVTVWDVRQGRAVASPAQHAGKVIAVDFLPGTSLLVSAGVDPIVRVWDMSQRRTHLELRHNVKIERFVASRDGRLAATGTTNSAYVWDLQTGRRLAGPLQHQGRVWNMEFSPDGQRLATASADKTVLLWDTKTGRKIGKPIEHHDTVRSAMFSPEGLRLVTASWDRTVRVWDANTGEPMTEAMPHFMRVFHSEFHPDGTRILAASNSKFVTLWHVPGSSPVPEPMMHEHRVKMATFNSDSALVLTASADGTARLWDGLTGFPVGSPMRHTRELNCAAFSPDSRLVVTGGDDGLAAVWDVSTGERLTGWLRHEAQLQWACFSSDSRLLATCSSDGTARVWEARTGTPVGQPFILGTHIQTVSFSPDTKLLLTASSQGQAHLWDLATGQPRGPAMAHQDKILRAVFSPDGRSVLTAASDGSARLWDTATCQPRTPPLRHLAEVRDAEFSPDGRRVATSSLDMTARLWDAQTGLPLAEPFQHAGWVLSSRFSPDGRWLATVCTDGHVAVWDLANGKLAAKSLHHKRLPRSAEFSPDGTCLVVAGEDEQANLWPLCLPPAGASTELAELAEALAGSRFDEQGLSISVGPMELWNAQQRLRDATLVSDPFYARWGAWFLSETNSRPVWPSSPHTLTHYVDRLLKLDTPAAIRHAVRVAPTDARAFTRLAAQLLREDPAQHPRARGDADWLSRRALALMPGYEPALQVQRALSAGAAAGPTGP